MSAVNVESQVMQNYMLLNQCFRTLVTSENSIQSFGSRKFCQHCSCTKRRIWKLLHLRPHPHL